MRPVLLEMAGFGSFREPTSVDFRGAEYFALVGPTGAGKSTVIDAMTFALYGTVARWDDARTVALALAPTVARGTVRFVFDVAGPASGGSGGRYVVARELRRAAKGGVSVRTARLERLRDPAGVGAVEEETDPVADGAAATTRAVTELLGLPFDDFTTCVVLPQGEFAEFLHTEPRKRQETLVRLLGLGVYDVVAKEANTEARRQEQRAQLLTEQLGGYADDTEAAERAAADRITALAEVRARVAAAAPRLTAVAAELAGAEATRLRLDDERVRLTGHAAPDALADLAGRRRHAASVLTTARDALDVAEKADAAARDAVAGAPARAPLEAARRHHAERAALVAELPGARERLVKAREADAAAAVDADIARGAVDAARTTREAAAVALAEVRDVGSRLAAERDALRGAVAPALLDALDARRTANGARLDRTTTALAAAERADAGARAVLTAAPDRASVERARRDRHELDAARADHRRAQAAAGTAGTTAAAAAGTAEQARAHVKHAQEHQAASLRADLAAALRPGLVVGESCPVCAQAVAVVPARVADRADAEDALAAADRALDTADAAYERARRAEADAAARLARARAEDQATAAAVERLTTALGAVSVPAAALAAVPLSAGGVVVVDAAAVGVALLDTALAHLDGLSRAARSADDALRAARTERDSALSEGERIRTQAASASTALRSARDPLVALGAPSVDDADPVAGWSAFLAWAAAAADARDAALPAARARYAEANRAHTDAAEAVPAAERIAEQRRREETTAARAEQEASGAVTQMEERERELTALLSGAPDDAEAAAALRRITGLEEAVHAAAAAVRSGRGAARDAERSAATVERELDAAWARLRAVRDPLVALGAPAIGAADLGADADGDADGSFDRAGDEGGDRAADGDAGADLGSAWAALLGWARTAAAARVDGIHAAERAAATARAQQVAGARALRADLAEHDIPLGAADPGDEVLDPAVAATAVATAVERARGAHARLVERRAAAAALLADRDTAASAQQVAKLLGQLLRSDGFPRWLVASALDTLVADASVSLAELSGGQFELTHENGEFVVVDHTDADARRPVKTLSGGETFQASLALALALSAQMSGLAVRGAARLESIFLDEGFGTLDEANLETVASTLEALATRGDRVVGVITHVPALAERVPVRFAVRRDQRGSSVVREGA